MVDRWRTRNAGRSTGLGWRRDTQRFNAQSLPNIGRSAEFLLSLAALLGWRFSLGPLARLSGQPEEALRHSLANQVGRTQYRTAQPESDFAFTRYLNWFHLRRYVATNQPQFAKLVAQTLKHFFRMIEVARLGSPNQNPE